MVTASLTGRYCKGGRGEFHHKRTWTKHLAAPSSVSGALAVTVNDCFSWLYTFEKIVETAIIPVIHSNGSVDIWGDSRKGFSNSLGIPLVQTVNGEAIAKSSLEK